MYVKIKNNVVENSISNADILISLIKDYILSSSAIACYILKRALVVILSLLFIGLSGRSQTFNFDKYSVEDGLVVNTVMCVYQDSKGLIWTGTNGGGVSVFDGQRFRSITASDGLGSNVVYSIEEDENGTYYFGTKEVRYKRTTFLDVLLALNYNLSNSATCLFGLYNFLFS